MFGSCPALRIDQLRSASISFQDPMAFNRECHDAVTRLRCCYHIHRYTLLSYYHGVLMVSSAIIQPCQGAMSCGNSLWEGLVEHLWSPIASRGAVSSWQKKPYLKNSQEFSDNLHVFVVLVFVAKSSEVSQLSCLLPSLFGSFQEPRSCGILSRRYFLCTAAMAPLVFGDTEALKGHWHSGLQKLCMKYHEIRTAKASTYLHQPWSPANCHSKPDWNALECHSCHGKDMLIAKTCPKYAVRKGASGLPSARAVACDTKWSRLTLSQHVLPVFMVHDVRVVVHIFVDAFWQASCNTEIIASHVKIAYAYACLYAISVVLCSILTQSTRILLSKSLRLSRFSRFRCLTNPALTIPRAKSLGAAPSSSGFVIRWKWLHPSQAPNDPEHDASRTQSDQSEAAFSMIPIWDSNLLFEGGRICEVGTFGRKRPQQCQAKASQAKYMLRLPA